MSLILTPNVFANYSYNIDPATGSGEGTTVTTGASNADGTAVTALSALAHDVHWLSIWTCHNVAGTGVIPCMLIDILQDPAGGTSWASLIDDLLPSPSGVMSGNIAHRGGFSFPIFIPAGTSIGLRGRNPTAGTRVCKVAIHAFGNPSRPDQWWCGSKVETLGATPASSRGTTVTPGTSNSYGSWTNIGSTTGGRYGFIQPGYGGENSTGMQIQQNLLQIGYSSTRLPGCPTWFLTGTDTEEGNLLPQAFPVWCDIPEGTQMQARIASQLAASPDNLEIALYGVY